MKGEISNTQANSADVGVLPSFNLFHFKVVSSKKDPLKFYLKCNMPTCERFGKRHKVTLYAQSQEDKK